MSLFLGITSLLKAAIYLIHDRLNQRSVPMDQRCVALLFHIADDHSMGYGIFVVPQELYPEFKALLESKLPEGTMQDVPPIGRG